MVYSLDMAEPLNKYDAELRQMMLAADVDRSSLKAEGITELRQNFVSGGLDSVKSPHLVATEWTTPASDGHDIALTTIAPKNVSPRAAIFHIHSGGMMAGDRFMGFDQIAGWAEQLGLIACSVEYRLAPENPYPYPQDDSYIGLVAFAEVVQTQWPGLPLIVTGMSAGGGLAAGMALRARDEQGPRIDGQLLMCPMLDQSNDTPSSHQYSGCGIWDRESNDVGWNALLGEARHTGSISPYAAPALARDLSDLPRTFLDCGSEEVFRSEIIAYADRLAGSEVPVQLHVWSGAFHGFDLSFPSAIISRRAMDARSQWLETTLKEVAP